MSATITARQIAADVERGLEIVAEQAALKAELAKIEDRLETAGLEGDQIPLQDEEREGRQFIARSGAHEVPIVFTADLLVKSFPQGSKQHDAILDTHIPPGAFKQFYLPVTNYKSVIDSGKNFRSVAAELLGKAAPLFISACLQRGKGGIPKSQTRIEWDRAKDL